MRSVLLAAIATLIPLAGAQAQPREPTRDFAATYTMQSGADSTTMTMAYSVALNRHRIEIADAGMVMIHDRVAGKVLMLNEQMRMVMEVPLTPQQSQLLTIPPDASMTRKGSDRVAGIACTIYDIVHKGGQSGTACISADGILLRAQARQGERQGTMQATRVELATQAPAKFQAPEGWQTMQQPAPTRRQR